MRRRQPRGGPVVHRRRYRRRAARSCVLALRRGLRHGVHRRSGDGGIFDEARSGVAVLRGRRPCGIQYHIYAALLPSRLKGKLRSGTSIAESLKAANVPGVRRVLIRQFLAIFAIVFFLANFALYLHGVLHSAVAQIGWLLSVAGGVGGAALILVVSPLAARIGDRRVAQIGLLLSFVAYGMLWFVNALVTFFIVFILWAVGSSMVEPTLTALLSIRVKKSERGAIMGVSDSINSLAMILGSGDRFGNRRL